MKRDKPTILIVDDEPSIRIALREILAGNYNLIEAETGEKTLRILQETEYIDLILLDYLLPPRIDGLEVVKRMKTLEYKIPVILVTGKGSEEVAVKAFRLGISNYIIKPFKIQKLQTIIKETLGPGSYEKSLVDKAIDFIEQQYKRPISVRDVAQDVELSLDYLERLFK